MDRQKKDKQYTVYATPETFSVRPFVSYDSTKRRGGGTIKENLKTAENPT
jgi:hypothetical protein